MNRSCAGQLADGVLVGAGGGFGEAMDERGRPEGVTVVSIDTKGKVAAELFARQVGVPQAAKSPADASSHGRDAKATAKDAKSAIEMR